MKIEVLFPEICNLYGDDMNAVYLSDSAPESEVIRTSLTDVPRFTTEHVDLVYMGPMPEYGQELAVKALMPYRDAVSRRIEEGGVWLITGNAIEIFGNAIDCEDGTSIPCLGLLGTTAKRRMLNRYSGLYLGKFGETDIVGFHAQFAHSFGVPGNLFETKKGAGLDGTQGGPEGIRKNNFFGTYLIGPICPLNPPFTAYLLELCGVEKPIPAFYDTAMEAYRIRVKEFENPAVKVN